MKGSTKVQEIENVNKVVKTTKGTGYFGDNQNTDVSYGFPTSANNIMPNQSDISIEHVM